MVNVSAYCCDQPGLAKDDPERQFRSDRLNFFPGTDSSFARTWPGYQLTFRHGESVYHITVENRSGDGCCILSMQMDGLPLDGTSLSLTGTTGLHHVTAIL